MVNDSNFNVGDPRIPELLGGLFDCHAAALALFARQWCDCADDVVQEALIELASQARMPIDPVAWLYRVVRNKGISASRSSQRRRRHEAAAASGRPALFETHDVVDRESREIGDLLAAQAGGAAMRTTGQADVGGEPTVAPHAQHAAQRVGGLHQAIIPHRPASGLVLTVLP